MDQYAGSPVHSTYCYAELAASFIKFLHYCSLTSTCMVQGKITQAEALTIYRESGCHTIQTFSAPTSTISPIFAWNTLYAATLPTYPGLGQGPNNAAIPVAL